MTQSDAKGILADRIQKSSSEWSDRFWAHSHSDRSAFEEDYTVYVIGSDAPDQADLGLVLSDFVITERATTKGAEILRNSNFVNDGNATITETFNYSTTKTDSFAFKFAQGLKVGTKAEVKAGLSFLATAKVEISGEITFNAEQSWSTQVSETFSDTVAIQVPPHSRVDATATLETETGTFSFVANAIPTNTEIPVQMGVKRKAGGMNSWSTPLSVFLPAAEDRNIPVSGTLDGALGVNVTVATEPAAAVAS